MRVSECMTRDVQVVKPDEPISKAAKFMLDADAGAMPVSEGDKLVGMITDRDIAVRAVAQGRGPETAVRDVMTEEILYVFEDQSIDEVARNMSSCQVRRFPVVSRAKRLVGIVSLGDLSRSEDADAATRALEGVTEPGGQHDQSQER